ncbi:response regulator transcription factor [Streptomyces sp. CBMA29]|uniref:response regulator transcription factor n=1 Tax=Streptomyces sp. CBMA29 TaxID=1896314 RepID=UPI001662035A|nr:response regulator transcription factor [Streptomyces sp. CBMA29]MBD0739849.1 hypothetical protein [Streptomyces sp. CBMA29]
MAALPSDAELLKLYALGKKNPEIAAMYGVTPQAVNYRFDKLNIKRRPLTTQANDLIGQVWKIGSDPDTIAHHGLSPIQYLRMWVRYRLGDDTLSARQLTNAVNFGRRLQREGTVLQYQAQDAQPFSYVPRRPSDGRLVVRWPADQPQPEAEVLEPLELPEETPLSE